MWNYNSCSSTRGRSKPIELRRPSRDRRRYKIARKKLNGCCRNLWCFILPRANRLKLDIDAISDHRFIRAAAIGSGEQKSCLIFFIFHAPRPRCVFRSYSTVYAFFSGLRSYTTRPWNFLTTKGLLMKRSRWIVRCLEVERCLRNVRLKWRWGFKLRKEQ